MEYASYNPIRIDVPRRCISIDASYASAHASAKSQVGSRPNALALAHAWHWQHGRSQSQHVL